MTWILDYVPYWAWIIIAGVLLIATYPLWSTIWLVIPKPVKIALAAIGAVAVAYLAGRNRGVSNEQQRQKDADAKAVKRRLDTNEEVGKLDPGTRDKQLGGWMRD